MVRAVAWFIEVVPKLGLFVRETIMSIMWYLRVGLARKGSIAYIRSFKSGSNIILIVEFELGEFTARMQSVKLVDGIHKVVGCRHATLFIAVIAKCIRLGLLASLSCR